MQNRVRQQSSICRVAKFLLVALLGCGPAASQQFADATCDLLNSSSARASGLAAMEKRQYGLAVRDFQRALDACPKQSATLLDLALAYARNRDFPPAIRAAQQFLESEPMSIPGRLALANVYFMAQRFPESRAECQQVLRLDPNEPVALKLQGSIDYLNGDFGRADNTFAGLLCL